MENSANELQPPADGFADPGARSRTFPLKWPVTIDGRTYAEIRLARLTVAQVSAFFETLKDAPKSGVAWPIYQDEAGAPLPQAVLDCLDDDDGYAIEKAASDFLPLRLSAILDRVSVPPAGEVTVST